MRIYELLLQLLLGRSNEYLNLNNSLVTLRQETLTRKDCVLHFVTPLF